MEPKIVKSHCNNCGPEREHDSLHSETTSWEAPEDSVNGGTEYEMLRCRGCGLISLRSTSWNSDCYDENGHELFVSCYPPSIFRPPPRWHTQLKDYPEGERINKSLLSEVYVSLQNNLRQLAAMGIRSILEHLMIDKVGDQGSFLKNMKSFEEAGFVSAKQREFLEIALEAGHASIHRSFKPSKEDLITLIDIAESTIESAYLHEDKITKLKSRIPPRP